MTIGIDMQYGLSSEQSLSKSQLAFLLLVEPNLLLATPTAFSAFLYIQTNHGSMATG